MKLAVTHETRYVYAGRVEQAHHIAHLQPIGSDVQALHSHHLTISPAPEVQSTSADAYGQPRVYFELAVPHSELVVTARAEDAGVEGFELPRHPFYQATLFQPQIGALAEQLSAASQAAGANSGPLRNQIQSG